MFVEIVAVVIILSLVMVIVLTLSGNNTKTETNYNNYENRVRNKHVDVVNSNYVTTNSYETIRPTTNVVNVVTTNNFINNINPSTNNLNLNVNNNNNYNNNNIVVSNNLNQVNSAITQKFDVKSPFWACPIYKEQPTKYNGQYGEDKYVISYFAQKNMSPFNRVYIEVGAYDGDFLSNTYALEHGYGWKGLLIEGGPMIFDKLMQTDRPRSIKINKALCSEDGFVEYNDGAAGWGGLEKYAVKSQEEQRIKWGQKKAQVPCCSINKLIRENGLRYVDVFSLDVEGAEEDVLNTFDWNIPVRLWIIEVNALVLGGNEKEKQSCRNVQNILKQHGYVFIGKSQPSSVNEFYEDPNFDNLVKEYIKEDDEVYSAKHCPLPNQNLRGF